MKNQSKNQMLMLAALACGFFWIGAAAPQGVGPFLTADSESWTMERVCDEHYEETDSEHRPHFEAGARFQLLPTFVIGPRAADADLLKAVAEAYNTGGVQSAREAFANEMQARPSSSFVLFHRLNNASAYELKNLTLEYQQGNTYTGPVDWDDCTKGANAAGAENLAGEVTLNGIKHLFQIYQYTAKVNGVDSKRIVVKYQNQGSAFDHFGQSHGGQ